jgi:hypothetical protein
VAGIPAGFLPLVGCAFFADFRPIDRQSDAHGFRQRVDPDKLWEGGNRMSPLQLDESLQLNDLERQLSNDLQWALLSPDVRKHAGKLVAVYKKCVVGVGTDRNSLVAQAAEQAQCRSQDIVVLAVPAADLSELPN